MNAPSPGLAPTNLTETTMTESSTKLASDWKRFIRPEIRAMKGYVPGEQPQGGPVLKLNTNENPYPPSPKVLEAIREAASGDRIRKYPDPMGNAFRAAAASALGVKPEMILCGNGSDDILTILARTFVPEGGVVSSPYPSYLLYQTLADIQGGKFQPFSYDGNGWELPRQWNAPVPHLTLVANPNSPSGTYIPPADIAAFVETLKGPVVVDEAYADFAPGNALSLTLHAKPTAAPVVISRTLSKSYALAGIRFGFAIADEAIIDEMTKVKDSYNCDAVSLAAATAAMKDQEYLQSITKKIIATREQSFKTLQKLGFQVIPSHANFLWCEHPGHDATRLYQGLREKNILVRLMNYPGWKRGLRISIGTDAEMDQLFDRLGQLL